MAIMAKALPKFLALRASTPNISSINWRISGSRTRDNQVMHANTKDMTDAEIDAIVSYLAGD